MTSTNSTREVSQPASTTAARIGEHLVTLVVFGGLIAIAWWGHRHDWKLPTFSALLGAAPADKAVWCEAHGVAELACIECRDDLLPKLKDVGWCKAHGVAQCVFHHPELSQLKLTPDVSSAIVERTARALTLRPRTENNSRCKLHERRLQFASAVAIEKAGVDVAVVGEQPIIEAIFANGEILYDQTRTAHLSCRVPGAVWRVERQVGDRVQKGDVLALIDAAEVGRAKGELMQAVAQIRLRSTAVERLRPLAASGTVADRQLREADAALQEAQVRLLTAQQSLVNLGIVIRADTLENQTTEALSKQVQFAGLSESLITTLNGEATTSNLLPLRSPLDGIVVERHVVDGEVVDNNSALFTVTDLNRMSLVLDIRQDDVRWVAIGQRVLFRPSDSAQEADITGTVAWLSTAADERTRTVKVRVDLPNVDGRLRAHTFGTGRIVLRDEPKSIVVPAEALHWDGCCHVVFVRDKNYFADDAPKFFHVRKVRVGVKETDRVEILAGLLPGEIVASKGSNVLESQLLKSNLGAGCGCTH